MLSADREQWAALSTWPFLLIAYQLDLAVACLNAWEFAPASPRLEPEAHPTSIARRRAEAFAGG